ncbi:NADPH-dependent F420 reductase [Nocardia transvalensis]|uniref:NADPH-dependent F420 reductase n=1 Tax=Nocardia transvalensis TaxID=37333 RepID=UPI0018957062|nr:NAD(P)-binding domain-containing protein [Nocardia transvalensis]MBF6334103.1 NAD(P)-binding domain-containing protein [Nocardia transvalensis]
MNLTLGLIGSGHIGSSLARLAVDAGMNVVLSNSRGPDSLTDKVAELGEHARAATPVEAAHSDIVVATIPLGAYTSLPAAALAGRTVIDTMNYYPDRDRRIPELDSQALTSSALVQHHLADSRVVKAFNNIDSHRLVTLARPAGAADRSALPIASDQAAAKAEAAHLLDLLGYDAVDIGTLADSRRSEPNTPLYNPYLGAPPEGMKQQAAQRWFLESPGVPVPAARITELADAAVRGPAGGTRPAWVTVDSN